MKAVIPYKDPLWAVMTVYEDGEIAIEGKRTEFLGESPEETGIEADEMKYIFPFISDRQLK